MRAAVLACGAGSVVSHRSAGNLLGLVDRAPVVVDVIAPGSRGRALDGIKPHDVRRPSRHETGTVEGIPCTSPARTLVDLAGVVGMRTLRSSFERAAVRRLLDVGAIEAALVTGGRRGVSDVRLLLEEWRAAAPVAMEQRLKSPLEAKILPLLRRRGIPAPRCNAPVALVDGRIEVDFLWPRHRFVVEADSRDFHTPEIAFERDRWRDRELLRVSHGRLRVTSQEAEQEPEQVADAVGRELARRRPGRLGSS
jgi:very-short-patch-repair endonuclease